MITGELFIEAVGIAVLAVIGVVPFLNIVVGAIVGGNFAGVAGAATGTLLAILLTAIEVMLLRRTTSPVEASAGTVADTEPLNRVLNDAERQREDRADLARACRTVDAEPEKWAA